MRRPVVLVVGDGGATLRRLGAHLRRAGLRLQTAKDCGEALEALELSREGPADQTTIRAVVLDVARAGFGAAPFREMLREDHPGLTLLDLPPDDAGPEDVGLLAAALFQALRTDDEPGEGGEEAFEGPIRGHTFEDLESRSPKMIELFRVIPRVARSDSAVLVLGQTGTGKELVAAAIHRQSRRRDKAFFTVNCGALPETLLESELFGHEKGAFTGATRTKKGCFELADGGTLFLDELGTISMATQVRLLRVLERMEIRRVGGETTRRVDVRIVAATNASLEQAVEAGTFREDLYYRLNVVTLRIPPLQERPEDVPLLAQVFLEQFARDTDRPDVLGFDPQAIRALKRHAWRGNVRELQHVIERAVILSAGPHIQVADLPGDLGPAPAPRTAVPSFDIEEPLSLVVDRMRETVEQEYLRRLLRRYRGHLGKTSRHAGLNRRTLYNKMQRLGLKRDDFR